LELTSIVGGRLFEAMSAVSVVSGQRGCCQQASVGAMNNAMKWKSGLDIFDA